LEWDKLTLNNYDYSTVRVTLFRRDGTKIYKEPMLLTTIKVDSKYTTPICQDNNL